MYTIDKQYLYYTCITQTEMEQLYQLLSQESSDEEKFVALMIIPKYIKINDMSSVALVFEKMSFDFLARLLICGIQTSFSLKDNMKSNRARHG